MVNTCKHTSTQARSVQTPEIASQNMGFDCSEAGTDQWPKGDVPIEKRWNTYEKKQKHPKHPGTPIKNQEIVAWFRLLDRWHGVLNCAECLPLHRRPVVFLRGAGMAGPQRGEALICQPDTWICTSNPSPLALSSAC